MLQDEKPNWNRVTDSVALYPLDVGNLIAYLREYGMEDGCGIALDGEGYLYVYSAGNPTLKL